MERNQTPTRAIGTNTAAAIWSFTTRGEGEGWGGEGIGANKKPPDNARRLEIEGYRVSIAQEGTCDLESTQTNLGQDALTCKDFGAEADHETHHGQAAIPGLSESNEAEAGG